MTPTSQVTLCCVALRRIEPSRVEQGGAGRGRDCIRAR